MEAVTERTMNKAELEIKLIQYTMENVMEAQENCAASMRKLYLSHKLKQYQNEKEKHPS